jgi:hypothetical protein
VLFFPYATKAKHWPRHLFTAIRMATGSGLRRSICRSPRSQRFRKPMSAK